MKIALLVSAVVLILFCCILVYGQMKRNARKQPPKKDKKHWLEHKKVFEDTIVEYMSVKGYQLGEDYAFVRSDSDENTTVVCYEKKVFDIIRGLMKTRGYGVKNRFYKEIKSDGIFIKDKETELSENNIQIDYMDFDSHKHILSAILVLKNMQTTITVEPEFFALYAKENDDIKEKIKDEFSKHFKNLPTAFDNIVSLGRSYCLLMKYEDKFSLVYNFNFDRENAVKRCYLFLEKNLPTIDNTNKSAKEILKNMLDEGLIYEVDYFAGVEEKTSATDLTHKEKILKRLENINENQNFETISVDEFMKRLG